MSSLKKQEKKAPAPKTLPKTAPKAPAIPGAAKKETAAKKPAAPTKPAATKKPAPAKPAPAALPKKTLPKLAEKKPAAVRKDKPAAKPAPEPVAAPEVSPVAETVPSAAETGTEPAAGWEPGADYVPPTVAPETAPEAQGTAPAAPESPATPRTRRKRDAGRTVRSAVAELIAQQHFTDPEIMHEIRREFPTKAINAQIIGACRSELNSGKRTVPGWDKPAGGYEQIVFTVVTGDEESKRIKRSEKPASERKPRNARPKYAPGEDPLEKLGFNLTPTKRKPAARKRLAPAVVPSDSETAAE
jgi:hypothetical protein